MNTVHFKYEQPILIYYVFERGVGRVGCRMLIITKDEL
jgi:hypothetical protein